MRRPTRTLLIAGLLVAALVVGVIAYFATKSDPKKPTGVASDVARTIPGNGVKLAAEVVTPKAAAGAPLLVMPAGWGQPATEYRAIAHLFAAQGYQVVAYGQRGFGKSTGQSDFAGTDTQRDVSTVITWALKHTKADPRHVGLFGISYGAGISLLAAARDRRIRAVAALSTWVDVGQSFGPDGTPSTAALATLIGAKNSHFGSVIKSLQHTLSTDPKAVARATTAISKTRSPGNYVRQLNRNHPAIMLANGFADSIFAPAQLMPFFTALKTPKRLELAPGDHGGPELTGLLGAPNSTIEDARAWLDHYLRGVANDIQTEGPIVLKDAQTGALRDFRALPVAPARLRVQLGAPNSSAQTGDLAATSWRAKITAGVDSGASSGHAQLVSSNAYVPPRTSIGQLQTKRGFFWKGPPLTAPTPLNGVPVVGLTLGSTSGTATVFVYLYDVTPRGVSTLIGMQPYTALRVRQPRAVTIAMQPISWTVASGDTLALVVDSVDARYTSLTTKGAKISVASSAKQPAYFTAPIHS